MNKIWIICKDYGYEGLQEPFKAYTTLEKAQNALRVISDLGIYSIKLIEAEIVE